MLIDTARHLLGVLAAFVVPYKERRPHQSRHQRRPGGADTGPAAIDPASAEIRGGEILGGLFGEYCRQPSQKPHFSSGTRLSTGDGRDAPASGIGLQSRTATSPIEIEWLVADLRVVAASLLACRCGLS